MQPGCRGRAFACSPGRTREVDLMDLKGPPAQLSLGLRDSDSGPGSATRGGGGSRATRDGRGEPTGGASATLAARARKGAQPEQGQAGQGRARQSQAGQGRAGEERGEDRWKRLAFPDWRSRWRKEREMNCGQWWQHACSCCLCWERSAANPLPCNGRQQEQPPARC